MHLIVNRMEVAIEIDEVVDSQQCQREVITFYEQVLKDMLFTLRSITDEKALMIKAKEIQNELDIKYKKKLQKQIKKLLVIKQDTDEQKEDLHEKSKKRA